MKVATWNLNSITVRLAQLLAWLDSSQVDVLAIQETKIPDEKFPQQAIEDIGYHVIFSGQKTYNGVAIISKAQPHAILTDIPEWIDPQRRILAATIGDIRVVNLYIPNGSALESEKYTYKLAWLTQVTRFLQEELREHKKLIVLGDFNIAPEDRDVHDPKTWQGNVLCSPPEREAFYNCLALGLVDSFRLFEQPAQSFTWWDYRAAAFRRNCGLRIDHILLSQSLATRCQGVRIDKTPRSAERPSDHTPVIAEITRD